MRVRSAAQKMETCGAVDLIRSCREVERGNEMSKILMGIFLFLTGLAFSPAAAESVDVAVANCRSAPRTSAVVIAALRRGERAPLLLRRGGWSYIDPVSSSACWTVSSLLRQDRRITGSAGGTGSARYSSRNYGATRIPRRFTYSRHSYPKPSYSRQRGPYGGQGCPCSDTRICTGPRGGRYCITSGGNKRYGV